MFELEKNPLINLPKYIVFNKVLSKQNVNIHLTHDFFVHVCLGSRKSGDLRKHLIGRQVYNSWLYCCHLSCYWLFIHIYIYVENVFLLVCTWSARVTCMNDRTDVTVSWYIYDLHVKITLNDIYVPRSASASVFRDELAACDVNCLLT